MLLITEREGHLADVTREMSARAARGKLGLVLAQDVSESFHSSSVLKHLQFINTTIKQLTGALSAV